MSVEESRCDSCGHVRRTYTRRFPKADLEALFDLLQRTRRGEKWVHVKDLRGISGGGDFAKYRYWGLITQRVNADPRKRDSGFWSMTHHGMGFLLGEHSIYSHVVVREGEFIRFSGTRIFARMAYRSAGFNYHELMSKIKFSDAEIL